LRSSTPTFSPEPDFLHRTIPYFMNPDGGSKIGMVQTRWTYLNSNYSLLTNVKRSFSTGHFVVEQARVPAGDLLNFNGTAACGAAKPSPMPAAGSTPLTEDTIFLIARSSKAGSFSTPANRMRFRASRGHDGFKATGRWPRA